MLFNIFSSLTWFERRSLARRCIEESRLGLVITVRLNCDGRKPDYGLLWLASGCMLSTIPVLLFHVSNIRRVSP